MFASRSCVPHLILAGWLAIVTPISACNDPAEEVGNNNEEIQEPRSIPISESETGESETGESSEATARQDTEATEVSCEEELTRLRARVAELEAQAARATPTSGDPPPMPEDTAAVVPDEINAPAVTPQEVTTARRPNAASTAENRPTKRGNPREGRGLIDSLLGPRRRPANAEDNEAINIPNPRRIIFGN